MSMLAAVFMVYVLMSDLLLQRSCQRCVKVRDVLPLDICSSTISSLHTRAEAGRGEMMGGDFQKQLAVLIVYEL